MHVIMEAHYVALWATLRLAIIIYLYILIHRLELIRYQFSFLPFARDLVSPPRCMSHS